MEREKREGHVKMGEQRCDSEKKNLEELEKEKLQSGVRES